MTEPAVEALIDRAGRGDVEAFGQLFDAAAPQMLAVALRVCRDRALAEEAVQEAMLNIWQTASSYQPGRVNPRVWLTTIAHRRAVDLVRSEDARRQREERVGAEALSAHPDPVGDRIDLTEDHRRVRSQLIDLTEVQREAIELTHYRGHTYDEAAALLGIPLNTLKTRVRDAVTRLRTNMGKEEQ